MSQIDNIYSWENYSQIDADWAVKMDLKNLVDSLFLKEQVQKLEKEHEYQRENQAKLIELLKEVRPKLDSFYDAIKKYLKEYDFPTRKLAGLTEKEWAEGTVHIFIQQRNKLEPLIKEEYLKDKTLYKVDPGHPRRDFTRRLLQEIVKNRYPENSKWWGDSEKLYALSQKIKRNLLPNLN